jgi:hypothetical protein
VERTQVDTERDKSCSMDSTVSFGTFELDSGMRSSMVVLNKFVLVVYRTETLAICGMMVHVRFGKDKFCAKGFGLA